MALSELSPAAVAALAGYRRIVRRRIVLIVALGAAMLASMLLDLTTGPSALRALDAILGLFARGSGSQSFVLFGIALFFTFNALVAITQFVASEQSLQQLVFWMLGSLTRANMEKVQILALVVVCIVPLSLLSSWRLTALRLGQERARSFGINVARLRCFSLMRISLLTAGAVAFTGTIAFVGLVGPHIARLLVGEDHRFFLPASALAGACVMSLTSVVSKTAIPGVVLPIGIVTALIGVPFFLALVLGRRAQG